MESILARAMFMVAVTIIVVQQLSFTGGEVIGVNYGLNGDNLPPPEEVMNIYGRCKINFMRIFEPNHDVLEALRGKPFLVSLGMRNEEIQSIATNPEAAATWVNTNVIPYIYEVNIGYITVGNEIIPGAEAPYVYSAIINIIKALADSGIHKNIRVTTILRGESLGVSYPPSAGAFTSDVAEILKDMAPYLWGRGTPLMVNVYPYFAYASDPEHISLDYALFQSKDPVIIDQGLKYYNLFDAMIDAYFSAFEKIGAPNVSLAISETGWPSAGNEPYTSKENAQIYNKNVKDHVLGGFGTPKRPGITFDAFLFELFNEDLKPAGVEQNFGFFYPDMSPVYPFWSCEN